MKIELYPNKGPSIKVFPGKRGDIIHFFTSNRKEIILKCSKAKDEIITDAETYSFDFLQRWYNFKFLEVIKKKKDNNG